MTFTDRMWDWWVRFALWGGDHPKTVLVIAAVWTAGVAWLALKLGSATC